MFQLFQLILHVFVSAFCLCVHSDAFSPLSCHFIEMLFFILFPFSLRCFLYKKSEKKQCKHQFQFIFPFFIQHPNRVFIYASLWAHVCCFILFFLDSLLSSFVAENIPVNVVSISCFSKCFEIKTSNKSHLFSHTCLNGQQFLFAHSHIFIVWIRIAFQRTTVKRNLFDSLLKMRVCLVVLFTISYGWDRSDDFIEILDTFYLVLFCIQLVFEYKWKT